jgi:hypothetical protein
MKSVVDLTALSLAVLVAAAITAALLFAHRTEDRRRTWITAGVVSLALIALGSADILLRAPRELHLSTVIFGVLIAMLGAVGMVLGTREVRMWIRVPLVLVVTFVLWMGGLLLAASYVSRALPF